MNLFFRIVKIRVRNGVYCFEVEWEKFGMYILSKIYNICLQMFSKYYIYMNVQKKYRRNLLNVLRVNFVVYLLFKQVLINSKYEKV